MAIPTRILLPRSSLKANCVRHHYLHILDLKFSSKPRFTACQPALSVVYSGCHHKI
jgi:hypothetical protein